MIVRLSELIHMGPEHSEEPGGANTEQFHTEEGFNMPLLGWRGHMEMRRK